MNSILDQQFKTRPFCCWGKPFSYHLSARKGSYCQGSPLCLLGLCPQLGGPGTTQPFPLPHLLLQSLVFCLGSGERWESSSLVQCASVSTCPQPPGWPREYRLLEGLQLPIAWFAHLRFIDTRSVRPGLNPGTTVFGDIHKGFGLPVGSKHSLRGSQVSLLFIVIFFLYRTKVEFCLVGPRRWLT